MLGNPAPIYFCADLLHIYESIVYKLEIIIQGIKFKMGYNAFSSSNILLENLLAV